MTGRDRGLEIVESRDINAGSVMFPETLADGRANPELLVGPAVSYLWNRELGALSVFIDSPPGVVVGKAT